MTNNGGHAFPNITPDMPVDGGPGMTLRDYFAAKAMAAMIATAAAPCLLGTGCESQTAQAAYEMADAMVRAREQA